MATLTTQGAPIEGGGRAGLRSGCRLLPAALGVRQGRGGRAHPRPAPRGGARRPGLETGGRRRAGEDRRRAPGGGGGGGPRSSTPTRAHDRRRRSGRRARSLRPRIARRGVAPGERPGRPRRGVEPPSAGPGRARRPARRRERRADSPQAFVPLGRARVG
ncbi:MAG: hypothetical protein KDG89_14845, partial [Geminicoccaceae bacterium]|nr:hypothetical protein [Geminicoccaceae bacterium]